MGNEKKSSSARLKLRASLPDADRTTLVQCPACAGSGKIEKPTPSIHRHRIVICAWCDGGGFVDSRMHSNFIRWLRIKTRGRIAQRCPGPSK